MDESVKKTIENILNKSTTISSVARDLGVSRQTVYAWIKRYKREHSVTAFDLKKESTAHNKISPEIEKIVESVALLFPEDSISSLTEKLKTKHRVSLNPTTVFRILKRNNVRYTKDAATPVISLLKKKKHIKKPQEQVVVSEKRTEYVSQSNVLQCDVPVPTLPVVQVVAVPESVVVAKSKKYISHQPILGNIYAKIVALSLAVLIAASPLYGALSSLSSFKDFGLFANTAVPKIEEKLNIYGAEKAVYMGDVATRIVALGQHTTDTFTVRSLMLSPSSFSLPTFSSSLRSGISRIPRAAKLDLNPIATYATYALGGFTVSAQKSPEVTNSLALSFLDRLSLTTFCALASLRGDVQEDRCDYDTVLATSQTSQPAQQEPTLVLGYPVTPTPVATSTPSTVSQPSIVYLPQYITTRVTEYVTVAGAPGRDGADGRDGQDGLSATIVNSSAVASGFGTYISPAPSLPTTVGVSTVGYLRETSLERVTVANSVFNGTNVFNDTVNVTGLATINNLSATSSSFLNTTMTNATTTTGFISGLTASTSVAETSTTTTAYIANLTASTSTLTYTTTGTAITTNASTTNATTTNSYIRNLAADQATTTTAYISNLTVATSTVTDASITNATTTNFFATSTVLVNATSTNLFASNATTTNLFSTNSFLTNASSTNLFTQNLAVGNASTTGNQSVDGSFRVSGTSTLGANVELNGSVTVGTSTNNTLTINSLINSNLVPASNITYDLGSPSFFWRDGYLKSLTVNTLSAGSSTISGTSNNLFSINTDNATADGEDATLVFSRGAVTPNALIRWNATTKRLESNMSFKIQNETPIVGSTTLTVQGGAGQSTNNLLELRNYDNNILSVFSSQGWLGIGSSTPGSALVVAGNSVLGGNVSATGTLAVTGTSTLATTTITQATITTASTTNLSATGSTFTNSFIGALTASTATITTASTTDLSTSGFTATNAFIAGLTGTSLTVTNASTTNLSATGATFTNTNTTGTATITNASTTNLSATGSTFTSSSISALTATNASTTNLTVANNAYFGGNTGVWNSSGNVGIGTTSPGTLLVAVGASPVVTIQNQSSSQTGTLAFAPSDGVTSAVISNNASTGEVRFGGVRTNFFPTFYSSNAEIMRISVAGNVGIGTTTPGSKLSVQGDTYIGGNLYATGTLGIIGQTTLTTASSTGLTVTGGTYLATSGGNVGIGTTTPGTALTLGSGQITVPNGTAALPSYAFSNAPTSGTYYDPSVAGIYTTIAGTAKFLINANGNYYNGNILTGPTNGLYWGASSWLGASDTGLSRFSANKLAIGNGSYADASGTLVLGNVGIGTTTPAKQLDVIGQIRAAAAAGSGYALIEVGQSGTATNNWHFGSEGDGYFNFYNGNLGAGTNRMTISSSGNVGIGTPTPAVKLDIAGAAQISQGNYLKFPHTGEADGNDGKIGVGLFTPGLNIVGSRTDSTFRKIGMYGQITQLQNDGTNTFLGTNYFAGNVGIGTTGPTAKLSVLGSAGSTSGHALFANSDYVSGSAGSGLLIGTGANSGNTYSTINAFQAGFSGWNNLILQSGGGNVGIGTTNPAAKLAISLDGVNDGANYGRGVQITGGTSGGQQIAFIRNGNTVRSFGYLPGSNTFGLGAGTVTDASFAPGYIAVDNSGNVGIGTTTPGNTLVVSGGVDFGSTLNSGIGVTTGDAGFEMGRYRSGSGNSYIDLHSTAGVDYSARFIRFSGANGNAHLVNSGTGNIYFETNGTARMIIESTGNVNVASAFNSTGANAGLFTYDRVTSGAGGIYRASGINSIWDSTAGNVINYNTSGNVGIGLTDPSVSLDIIGSLRIRSASDGSGNIRFDAANPYLTASSYLIVPNGLYIQGGTFYAQTSAKFRAGIANDTATTLTVDGGTSGYTNFTGNVGIKATDFTSGTLNIGNSTNGGGVIYIARQDTSGAEGGQITFGQGAASGGNTGVFDYYGTAGAETFRAIIGGTPRMTVSGGGIASNGGMQQTVAINCQLAAAADGLITCFSDENLKDVFGTYEGGLNEITNINPIRYSYKDEDYVHVGFSAQNVQGVLPEATPVQNNGYLGFNGNAVLALTVNSIKDIAYRIDMTNAPKDSPSLIIDAQGNLHAKAFFTDIAGDVAETYTATEALDTGMVVAFASSTSAWQVDATSTEIYSISGVRKATEANDAVGVVSTKPGLTLGGSTANGVPVAFTGRVPVKVTTENGIPLRGDYLTVSRTLPGYAMKLTGEGKSIGRVISDYVEGRDKVMMVVENGYQKLDLAGTYASSTSLLTTGNVDLNVNGVALYNIKSLASANGTWSIDEMGRVVAKSLCIDGTCVDGEGFKTLVAGGAASSQGGMHIVGNYAYMLHTSTYTLRTLDITNPDTPIIVATLVLQEGVASISSNGNYLYISNKDMSKLYIVDISNPVSPVLLRIINTGMATDLSSAPTETPAQEEPPTPAEGDTVTEEVPPAPEPPVEEGQPVVEEPTPVETTPEEGVEPVVSPESGSEPAPEQEVVI